jgi:serine/threonine-protein kinase RsbW
LPGRSEALRSTGAAAGTDEVVLEIPAEPEHVRTARLFAASAARQFGVDEERVEDLKVAVSEAATNAMNAHHASGTREPIRIVVSPEAAAVRVSVVDAGAGFEPSERIDATEDYTPPAGLFEGSLGLALIRSLFPSAKISRNAAQGMTVSIVIDR